ncbi:MAG: TIGR04255 family protein [Thermodesulfobacteriota bacterium]|nr:TIGR04255 family protein [Thermodesulfobacteriota bacterium]
MNKLPVSINPCPIIEAIFEIRFESSLPDDAIFGIVYNQFKDEFQQVEQLPVLQLPAAIRNQDPNLKFTPHCKIKKDNFIIQIGPKVFSLVNLKDYCGWDKFSKKIHDTYNKLSELKLINKYYRTALRYINVFPDINIFNKSNLKIQLNDEQINDNKINFSSEFPYEYGSSNLKLINHAEVAIENLVIKGSIIDIDTNVEINKFGNFQDAIECAHHAEKTLFFDLLGNEFLLSLNPVYEEK